MNKIKLWMGIASIAVFTAVTLGIFTYLPDPRQALASDGYASCLEDVYGDAENHYNFCVESGGGWAYCLEEYTTLIENGERICRILFPQQ